MSFWSNILKFAAPVAGAVGGSELGALTGVEGLTTAGGALGGAAGGYLGGGGATGAALGGLGGALYANSDLQGSVDNLLRGSGSSAAATGVGAMPATGVPGAVDSAPLPPLPGAGTGVATSLPAAASTPGFSLDPDAAAKLYAEAPGQQGAVGRLIDSLGGKDTLGAVAKYGLPVAGLGMSYMKANEPLPYQDKLTGAAEAADARSKALTDPFFGGALPPAMQAQIDVQKQSRIAAIKSKYASMGNAGQSGSTAMQQEIAQAENDAVTQRFDLASKMANAGFQQAGISNQLYTQLANAQLEQDKELQDALDSFVGSFSTSPVTINYGR